MSGHSKWHSIKHKKAAADARRGKIFNKLIKEISVAARLGGGDAESNPRLRTAIQTAKAANMPLDNIKRAIMKGTGELPGQHYESVIYEGYGPGGVAVMVEILTDNKNRTVAEIRHVFSKNGGNLGESGCVNWMFEKKGYLTVSRAEASEERLLEILVDAGAEDIKTEGDVLAISTPQESFETVKKALEDAGISMQSGELTLLAQNSVPLDGKRAEQTLKLMEALEDHEDVQNVYSNFDIDDTVMETMAAGH